MKMLKEFKKREKDVDKKKLTKPTFSRNVGRSI
jgi:hypothetical protein